VFTRTVSCNEKNDSLILPNTQSHNMGLARTQQKMQIFVTKGNDYKHRICMTISGEIGEKN
jgi:hypothetical protein